MQIADTNLAIRAGGSTRRHSVMPAVAGAAADGLQQMELEKKRCRTTVRLQHPFHAVRRRPRHSNIHPFAPLACPQSYRLAAVEGCGIRVIRRSWYALSQLG